MDAFCLVIFAVAEPRHATLGRRWASTYLANYLSRKWGLLVSGFASVSRLCRTKTRKHRRSKRLRHEDAEFATKDITAAETAAKPVRARIGVSSTIRKEPWRQQRGSIVHTWSDPAAHCS
jgi:hypothetical protein